MRIYLFFITIGFLFLAAPALSLTKLNVPFTSQAPEGNWSQPWQDACEETVITMIDFYYAGKNLSKETAKKEILKNLRLKESLFGIRLDENAEKIADIINKFTPWEAYIKENPTLEDLKNEIDNGRPVIIPAAGKLLKNPYFQSGGPPYHTIVLTGYDDETQEFITNDPGTLYGLDFVYSYDRIIDSMHDFVGRDKMESGPKRAIFTRKNLISTALLDSDNDGLTKEEELLYGTILWLQDSDGDGYMDGTEILYGYSPTSPNKTKVNRQFLIKTADNPKVYLFENNQKRHILNETVFLRHGWRWGDIVIVSEAFADSIENGLNINS